MAFQPYFRVEFDSPLDVSEDSPFLLKGFTAAKDNSGTTRGFLLVGQYGSDSTFAYTISPENLETIYGNNMKSNNKRFADLNTLVIKDIQKSGIQTGRLLPIESSFEETIAAELRQETAKPTATPVPVKTDGTVSLGMKL